MILTINLSTMRNNIGVTDIGWMSLTSLTGVHLGTGVIIAVRHSDGTIPEATYILTIIVKTSDNSCAQSRYTQYETLSLPVGLFRPSTYYLDTVSRIVNEIHHTMRGS